MLPARRWDARQYTVAFVVFEGVILWSTVTDARAAKCGRGAACALAWPIVAFRAAQRTAE
jgi:hypothetical protein